MRAIIRRLVFTLMTTVAAFSVIEVTARVLEPRLVPARSIPLPAPHAPGVADPRGFQTRLEHQRAESGIGLVEDESRGWALAPKSVRKEGRVLCRINSIGLRGPEVEAKAPKEVRLLTLGDSSIFGTDVEEKNVFSSVAAARMTENRGHPVSAVIGGVPGYDSKQARDLFGKIGASVAPDWVVIGAIWSDLFRNDDRNQQLYRRSIVGPFRSLATWRVLRWELAPLLASERVKWIDSPGDVGSLDSEGLAPRTALPDYVHNLEGMIADARKIGARPAFVMLPAPMDFDRTPPPESVAAYRSAMRKVALAAKAPLVDGPALFLAKGSVLSFVDNVHPSKEGHAMLGEALADALLAAPAN